jgi:hypothetical protein
MRQLLPLEKEKDHCQVTRLLPKAIELHDGHRSMQIKSMGVHL